MDSAPKIRVVVRKRPLTKKEVARSDNDIVRMSDDESISVEEMK